MPPGKRFENWVVNKVLSRWQKLWSRQRRKKLASLVQLASAKRGSYEGDPGACPQEKIWKPGLPAFWSKN